MVKMQCLDLRHCRAFCVAVSPVGRSRPTDVCNIFCYTSGIASGSWSVVYCIDRDRYLVSCAVVISIISSQGKYSVVVVVCLACPGDGCNSAVDVCNGIPENVIELSAVPSPAAKVRPLTLASENVPLSVEVMVIESRLVSSTGNC